MREQALQAANRRQTKSFGFAKHRRVRHSPKCPSFGKKDEIAAMMRYKVDSFMKTGKRHYYIHAGKNYAPEEFNAFLKLKDKENRSPNTVRSIAFALTYYLDYLSENGFSVKDVVEMNAMAQYEHFSGFLGWIRSGMHTENGRIPSKNTANAYLQKVFSFYVYLSWKNGSQADLKVLEKTSSSYTTAAGTRATRTFSRFPGYYHQEERPKVEPESGENIRTLIGACKNLRDRLLLTLLAETGLRIGELLGVRYTEDITEEKIYVRYRDRNANAARAKNAEERGIKLRKETRQLLELYMGDWAEQLAKTDSLFVTRNGTPLTSTAVYAILARLRRRTGIHTTSHRLRHYAATARYQDGMPLERIQKTLGHKDPGTTLAYIRIGEEEMDEATDEYYKHTQDFIGDITDLI